MRSVVAAVCLTFLFCFSASADFDKGRAWFERLTEEQRYSIQAGLLLLGYYDGFVDGEFGPATYGGITTFEAATMANPSGVLTGSAMAALERGGSQVLENWGVELQNDSTSGASIALPTKLLTVRQALTVGTVFKSNDEGIVLRTHRLALSSKGLAPLYDSWSAGRAASYRVFRESYFVVSGQDRGATFYSLFMTDGDAIIGFELRWTDTNNDVGKRLALLIASYFGPADAGVEAVPEQEAEPEPLVAATEPEKRLEVAPTPEAAQIPLEDAEFGAFLVFKEAPGLIALNGEIGISSPLEFRRALKARPDATILALNSPGGLVDSALLMAHEVRELGLATFVASGQGCYSACAFLFMAGVTRHAAGELGVHQLWNDANDLVSGQSKLSDVVEALDEFSVHREVLTIMLRTPPDKMHVFSSAELARLNLNEGVSPVTVGEASPAEPAPTANTVAPTHTVSLVSSKTSSVFGLLVANGVTTTDATMAAGVFEAEFSLAVLPPGTRAALTLSRPSADNPLLLSVDFTDLPQTIRIATGRASIRRQGDQFTASPAR